MSKVDFHIKLDKELLKRLRVHCVEVERSVGEFVAVAIQEKLARTTTVDLKNGSKITLTKMSDEDLNAGTKLDQVITDLPPPEETKVEPKPNNHKLGRTATHYVKDEFTQDS
jgi:hypothetical protein